MKKIKKSCGTKASMTTTEIVSMVLVLAVMVILLFMLKGSSGTAAKAFDKITLQSKVKACTATHLLGQATNYCGHSEQPMSCSICLGATEAEWIDDDGDGMIDVCEKDEAQGDPENNECNYYFRKSQCCVSEKPDCDKDVTCTTTRPK